MCEEHSPKLQVYAMFVIAIKSQLTEFSWGFALYKISFSTISHKEPRLQGCSAIAVVPQLPVEDLGMVI